MSDLNQYITDIPKVELHMHIEGSLEPEMMFELAQRNGLQLAYADVDAIREAYQFDCLQDFLDLYYQGMSVLVTEQDFYDLTWAYLLRCKAQNVVHTEIFFDPQGHTERGVAFKTVIDGIWNALCDGEAQLGITSGIIMCFLRHLDEQSAFDTLEESLPWRDRIIGVGLDSSEMGHPPSKFTRVFEKAGQLGFKRVAHAGEEGPPEYVFEALDLLNIDRIDHGNRALEDPELVQRVVAEQMAMTVCPQSNLRLAVVADMRDHPLRTMLECGIRATVNSDDPAYFGGYMNENFSSVAAALDLDHSHIRQLVLNSFEASFLAAADKQRHIDAVLAFDIEHG
jgi:adenosine deaminase